MSVALLLKAAPLWRNLGQEVVAFTVGREDQGIAVR